MSNDVGKSWNDPPAFRRAARYVLSILALAALVAVITLVWASARSQCLDDTMLCDTASRLVVGLGPGLVLLFGGIGAFVMTFREWRAGRTWPIWQGAGWFLFTLMVVYLSIEGGSGA
ncbi:hypothetical protein LTV02_14830 [Nocardia yamanashiensis]|uniref:hypothetical protein n=1 Tax=Nocardia yamanashiensis TaxID=209247 RepID=UPI001E444818|nr:hypothetical protein [Nocardia yamanashiensis]UGT44578.1 hypothetical protein LTV02_14830 [Nocardia yamanashiensis]